MIITPFTKAQERAIGDHIRATQATGAWYEASYIWQGRNIVATTANGTEATFKPDGTVTYNIVLA